VRLLHREEGRDVGVDDLVRDAQDIASNIRLLRICDLYVLSGEVMPEKG